MFISVAPLEHNFCLHNPIFSIESSSMTIPVVDDESGDGGIVQGTTMVVSEADLQDYGVQIETTQDGLGSLRI